MELHISKITTNTVVLLDDNMRLIKPVCNFLKFQSKVKQRSLNTVIANGRDLKLFWEFLQKNCYDYKEVTPKVIGEFIEYLQQPQVEGTVLSLFSESERTGKTINRILSTIHGFYKYVAIEHSGVENPIIMEDVNRSFDMFKSLLHHTRTNNKTAKSIFKVKESENDITLIPDHIAEIFCNSLPTKRDKLIFKIMYFTGARIGEVLNLQIKDIPYPDFDKSIDILKSIKSKGKYRDLHIPTFLLEEIDNFIIEERAEIETDHDYLFVSHKKNYLGKPLTYQAVYDLFKKKQEEIDFHFNIHDLRHTFITDLAESGMDVSVIKIIAGHEHVTTTQKYTHLSNKYVEQSLTSYWKKSSLFKEE
ncbi:tyrosine-type recombinase/integrase [Turicibacter sanguinis]|uniref:tyrosine-type recombinase/integrase n=1 Tax=Turicibacter sanguinis TaxID=154288 RepID=UPI0018A0ED78|nr:tyrosine-type recombinase/integrase [Turicibacter sanguinis]